MNRHLSWANPATALNMRSLQVQCNQLAPCLFVPSLRQICAILLYKISKGLNNLSPPLVSPASGPTWAGATRIGVGFEQCCVPGMLRRIKQKTDLFLLHLALGYSRSLGRRNIWVGTLQQNMERKSTLVDKNNKPLEPQDMFGPFRMQ